MRKLFSLLFFICLYYFSSGQIVTVSEELVLRSDVEYELIGKLKGQQLLFQDKENIFLVQAFDENLKMIWEKEVELDKRRPEPLGTIANEEHFYIFYQYRWKGETIIKAHQYDAGANLVDTATVKNFGFMFTTPEFQIIRSDDRSKVLIFQEETDNTVQVASFDLTEMKFLWEIAFKPNQTGFNRDEHQIVVSNEGKMYFIVIKNNYRGRSDEHEYEIFHHDGSMSSIGRYVVSMKENLTYDVYFAYDNLNQQLTAGGLYGEKNVAWAKGYFLLAIPENDPSNYNLNFHEFDKDLVNSFLEKDAPSKNKGVFEAEIQEIILRRDGGILMVAERVKTNQRNYGANSASNYYNRSLGTVSGLTDYYYEHLLVISIHPDGETHWADVLHKKQYSQDDNAIFSSYFLLKTPSSLHFVFNDEIKEENTVSEYIIQGNGDFERNSVMSTDNQKLRLRFREGIQTGVKEVIVPSERRNRLKLVRVVFE